VTLQGLFAAYLVFGMLTWLVVVVITVRLAKFDGRYSDDVPLLLLAFAPIVLGWPVCWLTLGPGLFKRRKK